MTRPGRNLHIRVNIGQLDRSIQRSVRSNRGKAWSTTLPGIYALREWLLEKQNFRCAYCQMPITSVRLGHCELDHVLPKAPSSNLNRELARSNALEHRYHTFGYKRFKFVPQNLAVTCKQCNTFKGSFDPLSDRAKSPGKLPYVAVAYCWVHPQLHNYARHISIDQEWFYKGLSKQGSNTIRVCKLDKAEVVSRKRQADALVAQSDDLEDFLIKYGAQFENIGATQGIAALTSSYGIDETTADVITAMFADYSLSKGAEAFCRTLAAALECVRNASAATASPQTVNGH